MRTLIVPLIREQFTQEQAAVAAATPAPDATDAAAGASAGAGAGAAAADGPAEEVKAEEAKPAAAEEGKDKGKDKDAKKDAKKDDDGSSDYDEDHRLVPYEMPSVLCSKCSMYGPSMQTGNKECIDCKLCEKCCEKVRLHTGRACLGRVGVQMVF